MYYMRDQKRYVYLSFYPNGSSQNIQVSGEKKSQLSDFVHLKINWVRVQTTYHSFPTSIIQLSENSAASVDVSLSAGNYTVSTFIVELANKLTAAGAGTYTVTYSSVTGKLTIVVSGGGVTDFRIGFTTNSRILERYLGVTYGTSGTPSYQLSSSGTTLITPSSCIPSAPNMLYLKSTALNNIIVKENWMINRDIDDGILNDIADVIIGFPPIAEANSEFLLKSDVEFLVASAKQSMPSVIDVDIVDEYDTSINFLGGAVSLELCLY